MKKEIIYKSHLTTFGLQHLPFSNLKVMRDVSLQLTLFFCAFIVGKSLFAQGRHTEFIRKLKEDNPQLYSGFKGAFTVTENGIAVYNLPIIPTPGVGGMTPEISLSYNSNNSTSFLGEGWALNGFSFISRSGSIRAIDGFAQPVSFEETDNLQLDGQRLIPFTAEMHGHNGCVYTTENNSFKRITIGKSQANTIDDTRFFKVETKDGLEYYYGDVDKATLNNMGLQHISNALSDPGLKGIVNSRTATANSTPFLWLVTLVIDKNKNWVYFRYNMGLNYYSADEIFYGGSGSNAIGSIKFKYYWENRTVSGKENPWGWETTKYVRGEKVTINKPLERIICNYTPPGNPTNKIVKTYHIDYIMDAVSQKLQLRYVYQSTTGNIPGNATLGRPMSDSANKVIFSWDKALKTRAFSQPAITKQNLLVEEDYKIAIADFNGDGFPDKLMYKNHGDKVVFASSLNDKRGNFTLQQQIDSVKTSIDKNAKSFTGDFNADGRNDIIFLAITNNKLNYFLCTAEANSNGRFTGFTAATRTNVLDLTDVDPKIIRYGVDDLNADAFTDIMVYYLRDNDVHYQNILFNKDSSITALKKTEPKGNIASDLYASQLTDINGDGLSDLLFTWTNTSGWFIRSFISTDSRSLGLNATGNNTSTALKSTTMLAATIKLPEGVSLQDVLRKIQSGEINADSVARMTGVENTIVSGDYSRFGNIMYGDINKDGNIDLLISNTDADGWVYYTAMGKGDGQFIFNGPNKITANRFLYNYRSNYGDFNGDGNTDIILQNTNASGWQYMIAYGGGDGNFALSGNEAKFDTLSKKNFTYSQVFATDNVMPYCHFSWFGLARVYDDGRIKKAFDCDVRHYECFVRNIRVSFPIETGFFPHDVTRYFANPMRDPMKEFIPQNLNFDRNVKRIVDVQYWGDSIVGNPTPIICGGNYSYYTKVTYGDYWQPYVLDLNGDGISDLMLAYPRQPTSDTVLRVPPNDLDDATYTFAVLNRHKKSGLLSEIVHSNKSRIVIRYASIMSDESTIEPEPLAYPFLYCKAPIYTVNRVGLTNGVTLDSLNWTHYKYYNGIVSLAGKGFLGFAASEAINLTNGNASVKLAWTDARYLQKGVMPTKSIKTLVKSVEIPIAEDYFSYTLIQHPTVASFNIYNSEKTSATYDLVGKQTSLSKSVMKYDVFGNLTESDISRGFGSEEITQKIRNTYYDTVGNEWEDNWLLGRLATTQVTTTRGNQSVTRKSAYWYNATTGQLIKEISDAGNREFSLTKEYRHNQFGNIDSSVIYPTFNPTEKKYILTKYTPDHRFVLSAVDPGNYQTNNKYDLYQGLLLQSDYAEKQNVTKFQPDEFGRFQKITSADGTESALENRICRRCEVSNAAVFSIETNSVTGLPVISYYDNSGRLIRKINLDHKERDIVTQYKHDAWGNIIAISFPHFRNEVSRFTKMEYDVLNRKTKTTLTDGTQTTIAYDGLTVTVLNHKGQKVVSIKNKLGELVKSIDEQGYFTTYAYDLFSRVTLITDKAGIRYEMKYDLNGNRIYYLNPNFKKPELVTYDVFGRKVRSVDPNEYEKVYEYDKLDRLVKMYANRPGFKHWIEYKYITTEDQQPGKAKLKSITSNSDDHPFNEKFTYTPQGQIESRTFEVKEGSWIHDRSVTTKNTLKYEYKYERGLVKSIIYPYTHVNRDRAVKVNYEYVNGTLAKALLEVNRVNVPVWELLETNAYGLTTEYKLGDSIVSKLTIDPVTNMISQIGYHHNKQALAGMQYSYDELGNVVLRRNLIDSLVYDSIYYDKLSRVIEVKTGAYKTKIEYAENGDIVKKTFGTDCQFNFTYETGTNKILNIKYIDPVRNRELGSKNISYNNYGNIERTFPYLVRHDNVGIDYNQFNLPFNVGSLNFKYSYDGSKAAVFNSDSRTGIAILGNLSEYYYDFANQYLQYQKVNILVEGKVAACYYTNNGTFSFMLKDASNTVIAIADRKGKIIDSFAYDIWGVQRTANKWLYNFNKLDEIRTDVTEKGYLNNINFGSYGLVDMGARLYNPLMGRFVGVDPVVDNSLASTQFFNSYAYGYNNPAVFTDPNGKFPWVILAIAVYAGASASGGSLLPWEWNDNWWKGALIGGLCVAGGYFVAPAMFTAGPALTPGAAFLGGATMGFIGGFGSTLLNGGSFSQALQAGLVGGLVGGVSGLATFGVNARFGENPAFLSENYFARATVQGINEGLASEALGGSFEHGFLAGSFKSASTPLNHLPGTTEDSRIIIAGMIGGTTSALGGGKFANGAVSGAMTQIYYEGVRNRALSNSSATTDHTPAGAPTSGGGRRYALLDKAEFETDIAINPILKENVAQDNYRVSSTYRTDSRNHMYYGGVDLVRSGASDYEYIVYAQKLSQNLKIFCQYEKVYFIGNSKIQIDTRFYQGQPMSPASKINPDHPASASHVHCDLRPR